MQIDHIELFKLEIPFRFSFKHSSYTRKVSESIVVKIISQDIEAYGESCPRTYVTRENYRSCLDFFEAMREPLLALKIENLESLQIFRKEHSLAISKNPAAWCAIEIALLDLLSKSLQTPLNSILSLPVSSGDSARVSGVIGVTHVVVCLLLCLTYKLMGLSDIKLKLSGNLTKDKAAVWIVSRLFAKRNLRLDANNLWKNRQEAASYLNSLGDRFWAIEEPLVKDSLENHQKLAETIKKDVILDEHFLTLEQIQYAKDLKRLVWNLRISKNGGLLNAIDIMHSVEQEGQRLILGSQVGETSLLSKVASLCFGRSIFLGYELAYSAYLLSEDIFTPSIRFGRSGRFPFLLHEKLGFDSKINQTSFLKWAKKLSS